MDPESWKRREEKALWLLEHAEQSPPVEPLRGMALQLRLWRYSRSGGHLSWSIILPVRDYRARRAVVREVAWDRSADWKQTMTPLKGLKRRQAPAPFIQIRDAEVDWTDLAPFLDAAGGLPMGALGKNPGMPPEEDASGLEGYRSLAHIRLEWAGKGPRGWRSTVAWHARFRGLLVRVMRERDTEAREG